MFFQHGLRFRVRRINFQRGVEKPETETRFSELQIQHANLM